MQRLSSPLPLFIDTRGALLDAGFVYIGAAGEDPEIEANQLGVFADSDGLIQLEQPLRTLGGLIVSGQNAVPVFFDEDDFSITVRDANSQLVYALASALSIGGAAPSYQPLSSDLTDIDSLATTGYGRNLLTLANTAALQAAVGLPLYLPLAGGTVTGNLTRQAKGVHLYHNDPAMTGGRVFITAAGAADPTSQPGDIWLVTS